MIRKLVFHIAIVLDPILKFGHIPNGEHKFFMETLLNMLESVCPIQASTYTPIDDLLTSLSHKRSKVVMQFMERQSYRFIAVKERLAEIELEEYLHEPCIDCLRDDSSHRWRKIGSNKYSRILVLTKEFISICVLSSPSERLFCTSKGIITFRR